MLVVGRYARAAAANPTPAPAAASASTPATSSPSARCAGSATATASILRSPSFAITADTGARGLPRGAELELRADHRGVQRRGVRAGQRGRRRRDAALHDERARVRGDPRRRSTRRARTSSARSPSPTTSRSRRRRPARRRRRGGAAAAPAAARRRRAPRAERARALEHRAAPRAADDAAPLRRARRLLLRPHGGLRHDRAARGAHASTSRGSVSSARTGATGDLCYPKKPIVYYVDPDTPEQWKPWIRKAITRLAAGVRGRGLQGRHHRRRRAGERSRLVAGRHPPHRWCAGCRRRSRTPSVRTCSDPRTGEILNGSSRIFHNLIEPDAATGTSRRRRSSIRARARSRSPTR